MAFRSPALVLVETVANAAESVVEIIAGVVDMHWLCESYCVSTVHSLHVDDLSFIVNSASYPQQDGK